jgi:hypothetical protein
MNPATNKFEPLSIVGLNLYRPDGSLVPEHWVQFQIGDLVTIKNYTFRVAYIGESTMLVEPVGPILMQSPDQKGVQNK